MDTVVSEPKFDTHATAARRVSACGKDVPRDARRERGGTVEVEAPGPFGALVQCSSLAPGPGPDRRTARGGTSG